MFKRLKFRKNERVKLNYDISCVDITNISAGTIATVVAADWLTKSYDLLFDDGREILDVEEAALSSVESN